MKKQKRIIFFATVLLQILSLGSFISSCGSDKKAISSTKPSTADSAAVAPVITAFNDDCITSGLVNMDAGLSGRIHLKIENASQQTHGIGYSGQTPNVVVTFNNATINSPAIGSYNFDIVLRNLQQCAQLTQNQINCNPNGGQVTSTGPYDTLKRVTFIVSDPGLKNINSSNLGANGGLVGDVLMKKGLIGTLMPLMGGMLGGTTGGSTGVLGGLMSGITNNVQPVSTSGTCRSGVLQATSAATTSTPVSTTTTK